MVDEQAPYKFSMSLSLEQARQLDQEDPLKEFRNRFVIPTHGGKEQVYLLGNSLGLQPKTTRDYIEEVLEEWASHGVESFFRGRRPWLEYHDELVKPLSKIVGALPSELVVMNQLTINLHLMMASFYRPDSKRNKIICEAKAFPSDQYMFETQVKHHGLNPGEAIIEVEPRPGEHLIRNEDIIEVIQQHGDSVAVVLFSGVNYYTGQVFDIASITKAAHEVGAVAGWDLAHAAGNIEVSLHDWDVDFACWCSYKYLNSGPGAIAGAFIHERFHDADLPRLAGWWGYKNSTRFQMKKGFDPAPSAEGWQLSTPSILLYACHKASLDIFEEAGMNAILEKSEKMKFCLYNLLQSLQENDALHPFEILSPANARSRGCQVSLLIKDVGRRVFDSLSAAGIYADWREPDVIRVAPVPLYNSFEEVYWFVKTLGDNLRN